MTEPGDPSSYGFFGSGYWGQRVFWYNVPVQQRTLDQNLGGPLENLLSTWGDESETFLQQIYELPGQRDPYLVRAGMDEDEWFYATEVFTYEDPFWGTVVRLVGEKVYADMPETDVDSPPSPTEAVLEEWFPWFPYAPISKIARWWKVRYGYADYSVVRVRTRSFDWPGQYDAAFSQANEVWVVGGDLTIKFDNMADSDWTGIGDGDGTDAPAVELPVVPIRLLQNDSAGPPWYTADAKLMVRVPMQNIPPLVLYDVPTGPGDTGNLYLESGTPGTIDTATSYGTVNYLSGEIVLELSSSGDVSNAALEIGAKWIAKGMYFQFHPPRVIDNLAHGFGFSNDQNDPVDVQRSAIANVSKYFGQKAAWDSYRIRGEISLFTVNALSLWNVSDYALWLSLPAGHKFEYDGLYYTDLAPRLVRFDDIAADVLFYDPDTSTYEPVLDDAMMYPDESTDGYSLALAFALDVVQGYYHPSRSPATVTSSTALTAAELVTYGLPAGFRVVVSMTQNQFDEFAFTPGLFGLTEYDKTGVVPPALSDDVLWIDREDEASDEHGWSPGSLEWTIILGTATGAVGPTVGGDVAIRYWPEISMGDCCFCPASKMRVEVESTADAEAFYDTPALLLQAVDRLKSKLVDKLVPIHAIVADYAFIFSEELEDVDAGITKSHVFEGGEFEGAQKVTVTIEQRGDLNAAGEWHSFQILDEDDNVVVNIGQTSTGSDDPVEWFDVLPYVEYDVTTELAGQSKVTVKATAGPSVVYGDVQWTFKVSR